MIKNNYIENTNRDLYMAWPIENEDGEMKICMSPIVWGGEGTLADSLERDGVISSDDIGTVISIVDSAREEFANSLLVNNTQPVSDELKKLVGY